MPNDIFDHSFIYEDRLLMLLVKQLYQHMRTYGYVNVQVPAIDKADIFLSKAGDQIIENLFTFERFGKPLALRPEFTALAARRYAEQYPNGDQICRWQFNGSIFQDDHNTRGQTYQRMSMGAELLGLSPPIADAEIVSLAVLGLTEVAEVPDVQVHLGHIGLIRAMLSPYQLDPRNEQFLFKYLGPLTRNEMTKDAIIQKFRASTRRPQSLESASVAVSNSSQSTIDTQNMLDVMLDATQFGETMGGRNRVDIVNRLVKKQQRQDQWHQIADALELLEEIVRVKGNYQQVVAALSAYINKHAHEAKRLLDEWQRIIELTLAAGVPETAIHLMPGLTRGWNYYSGLTFDLVNREHTCVYGGGGRYDGLVQILGAKNAVPALGFAYYMDRVIQDTPTNLVQVEDKSIYLVVQHKEHHADAFKWASMLRKGSYAVNIITKHQHLPKDAMIELYVEGQGIRWGKTQYTSDQITQLKADIESVMSENG